MKRSQSVYLGAENLLRNINVNPINFVNSVNPVLSNLENIIEEIKILKIVEWAHNSSDEKIFTHNYTIIL